MRTYQHTAAARVIPAALCLLLFWQIGATQTTLTAGDIAFTGYNSDNPDDFSFVLLKNVTAGTTISFTDKGWKAGGGFRSGESVLTITFSSARVVGEQFRVPAITGVFLDFEGVSAGTSAGANILLAASGDQVFAFQGSEPLDNSPSEQAKFIAALHMNGNWQADGTTDQASALPPGLTPGVNALAISPQVDNARYNCSVTGPTVAALRISLYQPANWLTNDNIRFALPAPCNFLCGLGTDNRPPLLFCPFSMEVFVDDACDYLLKDLRETVFVTDNCGAFQPLVQSPLPGAVISGNAMITMSTQDAFGNTGTCSFQLLVTDTIPPKFADCLNDQTLNAGNGCQVAVPDYTGLISAIDNCDPAPIVSQEPAPGTLINQSSDITITLMDASGNTSKCVFRLNIQDVTAPTVACALDRFAFYAASCSFVVPDYRNLIKYSDNCDRNPVISQSPAPGTVVYQDTQINFTITDAAGNQNFCSLQVLLQDITPPAIQCPVMFTIPKNASCQVVMPDLRSQIILNDACDPSPSLVQIPAAGQVISSLPFVSFLTADAAGNFNFCAVPAIFRDNTPPVLACKPATVMLGVGGTYTLLASDVIASMSDNCGAVSVQSIVPSILTCQQSGLTVPVVVTVRDTDGNTSSCTAQVTVTDATSSPSGWTSSMVGNTAGSAVSRSCDNSFIIYSAGFNFGAADAVQFLHRTLCGNGEIIARVQNVDNGGAAGVMMRETLAPGSKKAALKTRLTNFLFREVRLTTNGNITSQQFPAPTTPRWLRLVRNGSTFTAYHSTNGVNWSVTYTTSISMAQCILIGVYAESINGTTTTAAVFDNVSTVGSTSQLWGMANSTQQTAPEYADMEVYPNPAENEAFVRLGAEFVNAGETLIRLFDTAGQPVWSSAFRPDETHVLRIPLNTLPAGVYVVRADTPSGLRRMAKLVVQPLR
jgi:hypothetical protein